MTTGKAADPPFVQSSFYRAVWRWHFFAGLLVLPFLVLLAVTGGLYLFKPEFDHLLYRSMVEVPAREAPQAAPSVIQASVENATGGHLLQMTLPDYPDQSVSVIIRDISGDALTAYADPYDGRYLGSTPFGGFMQTVRKLHSLQLWGFWSSSLIEIAAGWAIILAATGIFLWWPRGRKGGVVTIRETPRSRIFWRDLHAVVGVFAAAVILFLAITGMPWSMFWGNKVQGWATQANLGRPAAPAQVTPAFILGNHVDPAAPDAHAGHGGHEGHAQMPWALEKATPPAATSDPALPDIGIDQAAARFAELGLSGAYSIQPAEGPRGAYVGTRTTDQVENARTIYLDPRSGDVLADVGFADYGPAAKTIEWGIAVHQGQQYGPLNRYLMLAGCIAIVLLAVSAVVMWWKRRPRGKIGEPPLPASKRAAGIILAIIVVAGIIFPLVGASVLLALVVDWLVVRLTGRRSSELSG